MKENIDKYLNDVSRKVITEGAIQSPSFNFTDNVMVQVEELNKKHVTTYKPLISKTTWVLIAVGFMSLIVYALISNNHIESSSWLNKIDFNILSNNNVTNTLSSFKLPKILIYAVVFFGLMVCIQIPFLKNYFNKRLEL